MALPLVILTVGTPVDLGAEGWLLAGVSTLAPLDAALRLAPREQLAAYADYKLHEEADVPLRTLLSLVNSLAVLTGLSFQLEGQVSDSSGENVSSVELELGSDKLTGAPPVELSNLFLHPPFEEVPIAVSIEDRRPEERRSYCLCRRDHFDSHLSLIATSSPISILPLSRNRGVICFQVGGRLLDTLQGVVPREELIEGLVSFED
jgi:hypothetical protein